MTKTPNILHMRRALIAGGGALLLTGLPGLAQAPSGLAATPSMRGGSNNYRPGAPLVEQIGQGGFTVAGSVRRAGDGAPLSGHRIQIWAHTVEGAEWDARSHGATLTDAQGRFRLEIPQVVPTFGQPHAHLAYDQGEDRSHGGGGYQTVFLRPVMKSRSDHSVEAHFVLQRA